MGSRRAARPFARERIVPLVFDDANHLKFFRLVRALQCAE
jgi:hypothetical protein